MYESKAGAAARRPRFFVANTIATEPEYRLAWLAKGNTACDSAASMGPPWPDAFRTCPPPIRTSGPPAKTSGKTSGRADMRN